MAKLSEHCISCNCRIEVSHRWATLHRWPEQPWFDLVKLKCPFCECKQVIFIDIDTRYHRKLSRLRLSTVIHDTVPKKVLRKYRELVGEPPLVVSAISDSEEALIRYAARHLNDRDLTKFLSTAD